MPVTPRLEGTVTRNKILAQIYVINKHLGYPPTYRNIMRYTGIKTTSAVSYHLQVLEEQGLIVRGKKGQARALGLTEEGKEQAKLLREIEMEDPDEKAKYDSWVEDMEIERLTKDDPRLHAAKNFDEVKKIADENREKEQHADSE